MDSVAKAPEFYSGVSLQNAARGRGILGGLETQRRPTNEDLQNWYLVSMVIYGYLRAAWSVSLGQRRELQRLLKLSQFVTMSRHHEQRPTNFEIGIRARLSDFQRYLLRSGRLFPVECPS